MLNKLHKHKNSSFNNIDTTNGSFPPKNKVKYNYILQAQQMNPNNKCEYCMQNLQMFMLIYGNYILKFGFFLAFLLPAADSKEA